MKENSPNQDYDLSGNDKQQNSNLTEKERENDTPASGIKNNDAWTTGLEAKTPIQEGNPPTYRTSDTADTDKETNTEITKDPDDWKTGDSMSASKEPGGIADQNKDREKENSF